MDNIFITKMQFYGRHGVFVEETKLGQRFIVSIALTCDLHKAGVTDDLLMTVNYGEVYNTVKSIVQGSPFQLLEALAQAIADAVLTRFEQVLSVQLSVEKPGAPIEGIFEAVGVTITRSRGDLALHSNDEKELG